MENQNILTIKFNTLDDLAVQVADWNERLNHQCCGNCHGSNAPTETVCETIDVEAVESTVEPKMVKTEKAETKEEKASNKDTKVEQKQDVPVTDFDGKPTKPKNQEKVEAAAEHEPTKATKAEEPTPVDTELDVVSDPVDKKAFFQEMKSWMGTDKVLAGKVITIFRKHGVNGKVSSDVLTNDIITDLKTVMVGEE